MSHCIGKNIGAPTYVRREVFSIKWITTSHLKFSLALSSQLVGRIDIEQRKTGNPMLYAAVLLDFGDA